MTKGRYVARMPVKRVRSLQLVGLNSKERNKD